MQEFYEENENVNTSDLSAPAFFVTHISKFWNGNRTWFRSGKVFIIEIGREEASWDINLIPTLEKSSWVNHETNAKKKSIIFHGLPNR